MAGQSPQSDPSLVSQLEATLGQLEQVVRRLQANPQQGQELPQAVVDRLQGTTSKLKVLVSNQTSLPQSPGRINSTNREEEWDDFFAESVPPPPSAQVEVPGIKVKKVPPKKSKFGILGAIATGLLGILVGIVLWIGIPQLNLPPLWDQIVQVIKPLSMDRDNAPGLPSPIADLSNGPVPEEIALEPDGTLPPVLEAPTPPQVVNLAPLPVAPLTPEQSLLAVIQRELVDLEGLYPPQLIQRIEPDFLASRLTLTIGDQWQQLSEKQQQTSLDALWQRAQKLSFQQLRVYSRDGDLIARSPVVGKDMVIFNNAPGLD
jgi:hypothetical protein